MSLRKVNLEMSLKPFKDASDETADAVIATLFEQWRPLYKDASEISIMLWASDGSEILEYKGELDENFEWGKWIGVANPRWGGKESGDPEGLSIHKVPQLYMENPPEFSYRWLKRLIAKLKKQGGKLTGKPVKAIATFDPGPEFAISNFKFRDHTEICLANTLGKASFVCCYAKLKADSKPYAAYPKGIPEGLSFGKFLGKQSQKFLKDMGYDAIWLSNGFGFGLETWAYRGALFDGKAFSAERAPETRKKVLDFWGDFTEGCSFPVHTRGSNFPSGTDLSSDAVPIREIYRTWKPQPPPNSPWAALNGDFGIELGGWMSHIAEVPDDKSYIFRFYTHDPWFMNSPWIDRYNRETHDIYLPLSISRINGEGKASRPDVVSLLTVDDSFGRMPDSVPDEVIPHIKTALSHAPDKPGPLVWVYPFDEIHDMVAEGSRLDEIFFGDWFVCGAINQGLPLNTVASTDKLLKALESGSESFAESILFAPAAVVSRKCGKAIASFVERGGKAILYGPTSHACPEIKKLLNVKDAKPLAGQFKLSLDCQLDEVQEGAIPSETLHNPVVSGGGVSEVLDDEADKSVKAIARAAQGSETRVVALSRSRKEWKGGRVCWIRGSVSGTPGGGHLLEQLDPARNFYPEALPRLMLSEFGWNIRFVKREWGARTPMTTVSRNGNAFYFSGYSPDSTASMKIRAPQGAPLFVGSEAVVENGASSCHQPKSWHRECRVFIEQEEKSFVSCAESCSVFPSVNRRLHIKGLKNATVRFFHEPGSEGKVQMLKDPHEPYLGGDFAAVRKVDDSLGCRLEASGVSGSLMISW